MTELKKSPRIQREEAIRAMTPEQLLEYAIQTSRNLTNAKQFLRIAVKTFRWVQKPSEAQDIEKFLDSIKSGEPVTPGEPVAS